MFIEHAEGKYMLMLVITQRWEGKLRINFVKLHMQMVHAI